VKIDAKIIGYYGAQKLKGEDSTTRVMRDIPKVILPKCIKNFRELLIHTCVMEELGIDYLCVHESAVAELVERAHLVKVEPKAVSTSCVLRGCDFSFTSS